MIGVSFASELENVIGEPIMLLESQKQEPREIFEFLGVEEC